METLRVSNLSFAYPEAERDVLCDIAFSAAQGDFVVLCGPSGCGKTTLLRQFKQAIRPHGRLRGEILFEGRELSELSQREEAQKIGFVQQDPENQIVTDKVWHELAFGLESLGYGTAEIRARVAEMASYFGIEKWFYKNVSELSGGQKQLLNLASIMAMQPRLLVLDEPTSQLDPIAASDFLATLGKINRELGTTIVLTEHRLEEAFPLASKAVVMDEGRIACEGEPREVGMELLGRGDRMFLAMPAAMRIWAGAEGRKSSSGAVDSSEPPLKGEVDAEGGRRGRPEDVCPLTVRDGRRWIEDFMATLGRSDALQDAINAGISDKCANNISIHSRGSEATEGSLQGIETLLHENSAQRGTEGSMQRATKAPTVLRARELWFKYEKDGPDIVKGLSLELHKGEFLALLGGNGAGKSTSLKLFSGLQKPYRGELEKNGTVAMLPQDPRMLFIKKTVREDLLEVLPKKDGAELRDEKLSRIARLCRLEKLLDRHPYDLSGGEQQRAALAKVLLKEPEILLLDEPTKGLDAEFKLSLAEILKSLKNSGVSILMVSHDVEFCAEYADRCALFFDGSIVSEDEPRRFFSGKSFYTTSANRIARGFFPDAVTARQVLSELGVEAASEAGKLGDSDVNPAEASGENEGAAEYNGDDENAGLNGVTGKEAKTGSEKLSLPRKILAILSGAASLFLLFQTLRGSDLSALINAEGISGLGYEASLRYALLIACLMVFAFSVVRRGERPGYEIQTAVEKRKLSRRTKTAAALILLLIPLTLFVGESYLSGRKYYIISLFVLLECMLPFFLIFEGRKPKARELVVIAVLCAIGVAGRAAFFMLPNFKPVMALVIIAGVAFGGETGFLVGALTMLVSNIFFSQGPWTPWQMFAMGLIGFLAGVLFRKGLLRRNKLSLCIFGALAAVIIYGGIMNPAAAIIWLSEINWNIILTYYITGFPVDLVHAIATWFFLWTCAEPMLEKLDRIKTKYGLAE